MTSFLSSDYLLNKLFKIYLNISYFVEQIKNIFKDALQDSDYMCTTITSINKKEMSIPEVKSTKHSSIPVGKRFNKNLIKILNYKELNTLNPRCYSTLKKYL